MSLVLSQRERESIQIGDAIVTLVRVKSLRSIRIAIEAPREIPIRRLGVLPRASEKTLTPPTQSGILTVCPCPLTPSCSR